MSRQRMEQTNKQTIIDLKIDNCQDKKATRIVICEVKRMTEANVAHANSKAHHLKKVVKRHAVILKAKQ